MYKYLLLCVCCFMQDALLAQSNALKIGDPFVVKNLSEVINFGKQKIDLMAFKNDLLILDYFTTSCGACIEAMPKNNALVKQFNGRLQIIPITFEKRGSVSLFMKSNARTKSNQLPVIVEDKVLHGLFPHRGVPHMVWIFRGKVIAITAADMVSEKNISKVLNDESVADWPIKNDFFNYEQRKTDSITGLYSKFDKYLNGAKLNYEKDTIGNVVRFRMTNVPPVPAFLYLFGQLRSLPFIKKERIVLNVKNRNDFQQTDSLPKSFWSQEHAFCYESTWSLKTPESIRIEQLIQDISNRLGVRAEIAMHFLKVWIVKPGNGCIDRTGKDTDKNLLKNCMLSLEIFNPGFPPIIMEGVDEGMQVAITEVKDFETLKKELENNGLTLEEGNRKIEALIINEY